MIADDLSPGTTLGPYRVLEQLGRGGMATVYRAHQPALARYVALKLLPSFLAEQPGFNQRFRDEALAVGRLRHPHILAALDYGEENGRAYLVTELVDGGTLAEQLGTPLPVEYVARTLGPIAGALDYAHARGVLHRDVKPTNILLARDGHPVLADFGLASMMGSLPPLDETVEWLGTPEYMAPEQAAGESVGPATDQYALAVVAYQMLTGRVPFTADTPLATLLAHRHKPLPLPREVHPPLGREVEAVLLKGLAKNPADRYPTVSAFISALDTAGRGAPSSGGTRRRAWLAAAIAVVLIGAVGAVMLAASLGQGAMRSPVTQPAPASATPAAEPAAQAATTPEAATAAPAAPSGVPARSSPAPSPRASKPIGAASPAAKRSPLPPGVLLADDFDDPARAVLSRSSSSPDRFTLAYVDGEYAILVLDPAWDRSPTPALPGVFRDAVLKVDARFVGDVTGAYALVQCRIQAGRPTTGYRLTVRPDRGTFALARWDDGTERRLIDFRESASIRRGNETNQLELSCVGSTIAASVNGTRIATVQDDTYATGVMHLGADVFVGTPTGTEARFDNLIVSQP